jgi:hypothetical protein
MGIYVLRSLVRMWICWLDLKWWLAYGSRMPNLYDSKTSLRSCSHTWVTLTAPSQIKTAITLGEGKKFKDWPTNQHLIAPNSCNPLHSQQGGAATVADTGTKPACKTFNSANRWAPCFMLNSPSHSQEKPAQPLGRLTPPPKKLNNK